MVLMKFWKYFDLFYPYDKLIEFLKKKGFENKPLSYFIFIIYALLLAFILLKLLALILGSHEAMMIVVSGSMEPKLNVGDIVVLFSPKTINTNYIDLNMNIKDVPISNYAVAKYNIPDLNLILNNSEMVYFMLYYNFLEKNCIDKNCLLTDFYYNKKSADFEYVKKMYLSKKYNFYDLNLYIDNKLVNLDNTSDIVVYYSELQKKEIIHRAVLGINALDGTYYLTKGDNIKTNFLFDADGGFYINNQKELFKVDYIYPSALPKEKLLSKHLFKIPFLGWVKLGPAKLFGF